MALRRTSKYRWLSVAAFLAMVFNQAAFAAHLCLGESLPTRASVETQSEATNSPEADHRDCHHAVGLASSEPTVDAWCAAHCAHVSDASQQGKAPVVPAVLVTADDLARLFRETIEVSLIPTTNVHLPSVERRLVVFPSFQI